VLLQRARQPRRELGERVLARVVEPRQLHGLVAPDRFHQRRAGAIGARRDAAHQRRRLQRDAAVHQRSDDEQALTGLEVERDVDRDICVGFEPVIRCHSDEQYSSLMPAWKTS
jgi:hypothetical protein